VVHELHLRPVHQRLLRVHIALSISFRNSAESRIGIGVLVFGIISSFVTCSKANTGLALDEIFSFNETVQLRTDGLGTYGCGAVSVDRSSRAYLLDPKARQIFVFERTGNLLGTLGGPGDGPGEFGFPGAAKFNLLDELFVVDIFRKRISVFSLEQGFRNSFLLTGTQSQVSDIRITSKGFLLASGFTRVASDNLEYGNWISRYDGNGRYLASFFPSSSHNRNWVWRISPGCLFDLDLDDNIYAVQHCEYKIHKYDEAGNLLLKFGVPPAHFVRPNTKRTFNAKIFALNSELETELRAFAHSWTRIVNVLVIRNKYILVILEMNSLVPDVKSKYVIDIWDKDGRLVRGGIGTDLRLVCKDPNDFLYFVADANAPTEPSCVIHKYVLRMN
jgi:hypothetical protein